MRKTAKILIDDINQILINGNFTIYEHSDYYKVSRSLTQENREYRNATNKHRQFYVLEYIESKCSNYNYNYSFIIDCICSKSGTGPTTSYLYNIATILKYFENNKHEYLIPVIINNNKIYGKNPYDYQLILFSRHIPSINGSLGKLITNLTSTDLFKLANKLEWKEKQSE